MRIARWYTATSDAKLQQRRTRKIHFSGEFSGLSGPHLLGRCFRFAWNLIENFCEPEMKRSMGMRNFRHFCRGKFSDCVTRDLQCRRGDRSWKLFSLGAFDFDPFYGKFVCIRQIVYFYLSTFAIFQMNQNNVWFLYHIEVLGLGDYVILFRGACLWMMFPLYRVYTFIFKLYLKGGLIIDVTEWSTGLFIHKTEGKGTVNILCVRFLPL